MYDLESGVSPNEGCTGSLHTHKNPGWTSKRIRFGDAGIKGRSEDWLPAASPAQPSPAPRRAPSVPSRRERCGAGRGAGAGHGSSPQHGRCPPAPHRAPLLSGKLCRGCGTVRPVGSAAASGHRARGRGGGSGTPTPAVPPAGLCGAGTRVGRARRKPLAAARGGPAETRLALAPQAQVTLRVSPPVPPHPAKLPQRLRARLAPRGAGCPSPAWGSGRALGAPGREGRRGRWPSAGVAGGQRARDGRNSARGRSVRRGRRAGAAVRRAGVSGDVFGEGRGAFPECQPAGGCLSRENAVSGGGGHCPGTAALSRVEEPIRPPRQSCPGC